MTMGSFSVGPIIFGAAIAIGSMWLGFKIR